MRIFKSAIISTILTLFLMNTALADWPPYQCPCASQIQFAANDESRESKVRCNHSDCTLDLYKPVIGTWYFFMNLTAQSTDDAKAKALDALKTLSLKSGPTFEGRIYYICRYTNAAGYEAKALAFF